MGRWMGWEKEKRRESWLKKNEAKNCEGKTRREGRKIRLIVKAAFSSPFSLTACVCLSAGKGAAWGRFEAEGGGRKRGQQKNEVSDQRRPPPLSLSLDGTGFHSWFDRFALHLNKPRTWTHLKWNVLMPRVVLLFSVHGSKTKKQTPVKPWDEL